MAGLYTTIEKDLKECTSEKERYEVLRQHVRENNLTFEQTRYILETI